MSRIFCVLFTLLAGACAATAQVQTSAVQITVDAGAARHAINPNIYGVSGATSAQLEDLNVPLLRYGGNNTSRYNWLANADNRGQDWYFESVAAAGTGPGARVHQLITDARTAGAQPMITIPIIDWVATLGRDGARLASFSERKYGRQTARDSEWFPDAGNGLLQSTGQPVANNDPSDANVPNSASLQRQFVESLVTQWGGAAHGGPRYYVLDNEHSLWHETHRDVQPVGATMEQVRDRMVTYATAIKAADPDALVVGPEEWGWAGYLYSGFDQQYGKARGWGALPDRAAHGGTDYLPWLLTQLKANGRHLLDVFSVHYYPDAGEYSETVTESMQLRRNRSTRSLWDPAYVHEGWIQDTVKLIPRLRQWVDRYYDAGTPIAITEYNWGAESHINGATAQADVLGIFGREGLDMAARWTMPASTTPVYNAIKLYRNYDGHHSTFGDVSIAAASPNPDEVAVFAAERTSDHALTVMVIAKALSGDRRVSIEIAHAGTAAAAEVYRLDASNVITRLPGVDVKDGRLTFTAPPQSLTLLVLPATAQAATPR